jgi:hypothetical protein
MMIYLFIVTKLSDENQSRVAELNLAMVLSNINGLFFLSVVLGMEKI